MYAFQLLGSIAELERESIKECTTMGRDRVAKTGKYTGGVIPLGYDLDPDGLLIPSARLVEALGVTEAEMVRDLFGRIAGGSTLLAEAQRLTSLGLMPTRRYGGGKTAQLARGWSVSHVATIIHNSTYRGVSVVRSRNGTLSCVAPVLVDAAAWERANQQLTRNRTLARKSASRFYLLRGLIICGSCGMRYGGANLGGSPRYRCSVVAPAVRVNPADRCRAKQIGAEWLEAIIWDACRQYIRNPGERLAEAHASCVSGWHRAPDWRTSAARCWRRSRTRRANASAY